MSSSYVRSQIKAYFAAQLPTDILVDFTAEERGLGAILNEYSISRTDNWYGIQFIGSDEEPIAIASDNNKGCYRENGSLFFHIVTPAGKRLGSTAADRLISTGETLRDIFRGARINDIIVESVTPISTESGSTLTFEGGWQSGSTIVSYYRDINL